MKISKEAESVRLALRNLKFEDEYNKDSFMPGQYYIHHRWIMESVRKFEVVFMNQETAISFYKSEWQINQLKRKKKERMQDFFFGRKIVEDGKIWTLVDYRVHSITWYGIFLNVESGILAEQELDTNTETRLHRKYDQIIDGSILRHYTDEEVFTFGGEEEIKVSNIEKGIVSRQDKIKKQKEDEEEKASDITGSLLNNIKVEELDI